MTQMALTTFQRSVLRSIIGVKLLRSLTVSSVNLKDDESQKRNAAKKLNSLLQSIIKDDSLEKESLKVGPSSEKVLPKKRNFQKPKTLGKRIVESAEEVAKSLPGKKEETEAQLLHKLLYKDEPLTETIMKAVSGRDSLKNILSDMPVERLPAPQQKKVKPDHDYSRAERVRDVMGRKAVVYQPKGTFNREVRVDLFGEQPLGIFREKEQLESDSISLKTWDALRERELQLLITHPPKNIYEQMVIWTERGMLWKFPIDNEQGMDEEKQTDFTEHVFLEMHLEDWCPEKGPIRHFMELVCVGLSRNYYLSAQEKKDHILWYRDFFASKRELLQELGAGDVKEAVQQQ